MREAGGGPRLLDETVPLLGTRREVRREQLDRDRAVERHIPREQHDPHAASPELALDGIAAGEHLLKSQQFGADRRGHDSRALRAARRSVSNQGGPRSLLGVHDRWRHERLAIHASVLRSSVARSGRGTRIHVLTRREAPVTEGVRRFPCRGLSGPAPLRGPDLRSMRRPALPSAGHNS